MAYLSYQGIRLVPLWWISYFYVIRNQLYLAGLARHQYLEAGTFARASSNLY